MAGSLEDRTICLSQQGRQIGLACQGRDKNTESMTGHDRPTSPPERGSQRDQRDQTYRRRVTTKLTHVAMVRCPTCGSLTSEWAAKCTYCDTDVSCEPLLAGSDSPRPAEPRFRRLGRGGTPV